MNYTEPGLEEAACKCRSENEEDSSHTGPPAPRRYTPCPRVASGDRAFLTRTTLLVTVQTRSS